MRKMKLSKLSWDSNFWEVDVYELNYNHQINIETYDIKLINNEKPYFIQTLISEEEIDYIDRLNNLGFRFIESKVVLEKNISNKNVVFDKNLVKNVKLEDVIIYKGKFYEMYGAVSRFNFLDKDKLNDFYYKWVINSINGELDDNCIGYYIEGALAGFITYKIENSYLKIGLVGVFPDFQGMQISSILLQYISYLGVIKGCNKVIVATQGRNIKAINVYIKNGFYINNIKHWYYLKEGV